jgi:hypothetical protein
MCGLVGIIARKPHGFYGPQVDLFEQMLILDQLRGKDSAGAMMATRNGDQMVIKHATRHVSLMFETKEWSKFRQRVSSTGRFVVGHNRQATRGKTSSENAHPFVEGRIMLVHNGTLSYSNPKELAPDRTVEVDSNAIAIALETDTPENVIPKVDGAFALIWYNNENETLYAVRNHERPLNLITTENFYFLMSEPWMMLAPNCRPQGANLKIENVRELEPGELLSWDLTGKMSAKEVALHQPKKSHTSTTRDTYASWAHDQQNKYSDCTKDACEAGDPEDSLEGVVPFQVGEAEDPQMNNLRNILLISAQRKEEERRSQSCALMQPKEPVSSTSTTTTEKDSTGKSKGGTALEPIDPKRDMTDVERYCEHQMANQRNLIKSLPEFKQGSLVLIKILQTTLVGKFWKWTGKIRSPGKPMLDACGVLPDSVKTAFDVTDWQATGVYCTGRVKFCTVSSGGPSVFVESLTKAQSTDVYADDVPWNIWNHALVCKCLHCRGRIFDWERPFTKITTKGEFTPGVAAPPMNVVNVVCPDCLMKALPEGEIYDSYCKKYYEAKGKEVSRSALNRHSSVSNREPVSGEPVGKAGSVIVVPGSSTLQ